MRYLAGTGVGIWVAPVLAAVFVAYTWIAKRLVHGRAGGEVVGFASESDRKAA